MSRIISRACQCMQGYVAPSLYGPSAPLLKQTLINRTVRTISSRVDATCSTFVVLAPIKISTKSVYQKVTHSSKKTTQDQKPSLSNYFSYELPKWRVYTGDFKLKWAAATVFGRLSLKTHLNRLNVHR